MLCTENFILTTFLVVTSVALFFAALIAGLVYSDGKMPRFASDDLTPKKIKQRRVFHAIFLSDGLAILVLQLVDC
ncbi:MAG: hypothetical protein RH982_12405 [Parvibaculum sp.]